jgi:hypothetical protein
LQRVPAVDADVVQLRTATTSSSRSTATAACRRIVVWVVGGSAGATRGHKRHWLARFVNKDARATPIRPAVHAVVILTVVVGVAVGPTAQSSAVRRGNVLGIIGAKGRR